MSLPPDLASRVRSPRGLVIALISALFLSLTGAFGTGDAPLGLRTAYWLGMVLAGWPFGVGAALLLLRIETVREGPVWRQVLLISLCMTAPYAVLVGLVTHLVFGVRFGPEAIPGLLLSVLAVAAAITALNILLHRTPATTGTSASPPRFLDRLPAKLRGADIWAVEAEDHYLRLHTSKGQDLILLRLADAVAELEGIEGAQVHRSWWVSRAAIADARRGDGRATLILQDGAEVPVSRTYARALRERGWI